MNSARSLWKLLMSGVGVMVLASNCVVKTSDGDSCSPGDRADCTCSGNREGEKVCDSDGDGYGSCVCDGDTGSGGNSTTGGNGSTSGGSSNGGSTSGGSSTTSGGSSTTGGAAGNANAGAAGEGEAGSGAQGGTTGEGGAGGVGGAGGAGSFDDCDTCLGARCAAEFDACLDQDSCISADPSNPGQFEQIVECVENQRATQAVKRADLRACGTAVGSSSGWPPDGMTTETLNLVNCLATGDSGIPNNNSWADSENLSTAWAAGSCAKLACTSAL